MYPREHALLSAVAGFLAGLTLQVPPPMLVVWTVIAAAAGVLIDVDHVPIAVAVNGTYQETWHWVKRPWRPLLDPAGFIAAVDPAGEIALHRLTSHVLIFSALILLWPLAPVLFPVMVGVGVHIAADVVWDRRQGQY